MRIAFIGLGTMGAPMARRLAQVGHQVAGWDAVAEARDKFGQCVDSAAAALEGADVVITMLPEGTDVAQASRRG